MAKRAKRAREIEEMLQVLEQQMKQHHSGDKVLPDDRLSSLTKRIHVYKDQLVELSRELTDVVGVTHIYDVLCSLPVQESSDAMFKK